MPAQWGSEYAVSDCPRYLLVRSVIDGQAVLYPLRLVLHWLRYVQLEQAHTVEEESDSSRHSGGCNFPTPPLDAITAHRVRGPRG